MRRTRRALHDVPFSETASAADNEAAMRPLSSTGRRLPRAIWRRSRDSLVSNRTLSKYDEAHAGQDVQVKSVRLDEDELLCVHGENRCGRSRGNVYRAISVAEDSGLVDNFHEASRS